MSTSVIAKVEVLYCIVLAAKCCAFILTVPAA